jgi:UDP-N-acetylmuramoyl-tripeptide--D-alanyl-D-alanine ligase
MNLLIITLIFTWFIRTIGSLLYQVYLWQLKEYRLDRMRAHLSLLQGRQWLINPLNITRVILFFVSSLLMEWRRGGLFFSLFVLALFGSEALFVFKKTLSRQLSRPKFTTKAILIAGGVGFLQILPLGFLLVTPLSPEKLAVLLLALSIILPLLVSGAVVVFVPVTRFAKKRIINSAREKIRAHPKLTVVGITGSYGKTSTKEFLRTILSEKFPVLSTAEHHNTDIGVAQCILDNLEKNHQIFIVEMGAYKKGEISNICEIVGPRIGVITGINQQHLALFGSMKNLLEAKYELIEALPKESLAVFNGDNSYCLEFYKKTKVKKMLYSQKKKADIYANQINVGKNNLEFKLWEGNKSERFDVPLLGKHNVSNILAATSVALHLGMSLKEIAKSVSQLKPVGQTMVVSPGLNKSCLVDDTYNTNPDGVITALDYLKNYKGRKYLILQPMIELGGVSVEAHCRVGIEAARVCDYIFLTNKNFLSNFLKNIDKAEKGKVMVSQDPREVATQLKKLLKKDDVVLFEGKEAEKYLKKLKASPC